MEKKQNQDIAIEMAQNSLIQTEGEATSQILQAYKGVRYDSKGIAMSHKGRNLKSIKNYRISNEHPERCVKQQAGFSAELIDEARKNKNYIRSGKSQRIRTTDGIGKTNDTKYDHVIIDKKGNIVRNSGSQMKFYDVEHKNGRDIYQVVEKMVGDESWERYDTFIDVPKEQYEGAKKYALDQAKKCRELAEKYKQQGKMSKVKELETKAGKYENTSKKLRKSNVSRDEAIMARMKPEEFVVKEMICDVNKAGMEAAVGTAIFASAMSGAQNIYAMFCNEKTFDEAIADMAKDTLSASAISYGVAVTGTSLKAMMHSSKNEIVRRCGTTNLPTAIATSVLEVSKSIKRYANHEIDEEGLVEELGEKGTGMLAAGYGSAVGGMIGSVVPVIGTAIGSFIGSMVGYSASSILYEGALATLKSAKVSERRRIVLESIADEAIEKNNAYIEKMNDYLRDSQNHYKTEICRIFNTMQRGILNNDVTKYSEAIEEFAECFGLTLEFKNLEDFDLAVKNSNPIIL